MHQATISDHLVAPSHDISRTPTVLNQYRYKKTQKSLISVYLVDLPSTKTSTVPLSTATQRETMPAAKLFQVDLKRPLPKVEVFANAFVTSDQIVAAFIKAGGCIVKNAVSTGDLALIQKDVQPFLDADKPWEGDFFSHETCRVNRLAEKSKVFMDKVVCYKP